MNRLGFATLLAVAILTTSATRGAQVPIQWQGLATGAATAVDAHGAAGPQGLLEVANQGITYYTRTGTTLWRTNEQSFLFADTCCDAKAIFDSFSQRFFVIAQSSSGSNLHVLVSLSANPLTATTSSWRKYSFAADRRVDYPGIGVDAQALYVSYNFNTSWFVLNKAHLLNGTTNASTLNRVAVGGGTQGLQAVSVIGEASPGDVAYCVNMNSSDSITLSAITNVLGARTLFATNIPAPSYGNGAVALFAPQPGTTTRLHSGFSVVMGNAFWRNGEIWFCNSVASSNQPQRTLTRWYKLSTGGFPNGQASLAEWGDLDGGANTWRNHPAISGNARGDVCVTFTQSASNAFSSFRAAIRKAGQSAFQEVVIRNSTAAYTQVHFTNNGLPAARWADYCLVTPDPVDQTFWVNHLTILATDSVSTWWANITRDNVLYVDRNYVGTETGSYTQPFNTVTEAHTAATGNQTALIKPANYGESPYPRRFDKNLRLENPYGGNVRLGP